jgi:PKD repeat protein
MIRIAALTSCLFFTTLTCTAQEWLRVAEDPDATFNDVKTAFENSLNGQYYQDVPGWKQYKRWEYDMESRTYPSGKLNVVSDAHQKHFRSGDYTNAAKSGNLWSPVGPLVAPSGGDAGRVISMGFHPTDANTFFAGSPGGGFWKTTDGGASWITSTDQLASLYIVDILINPNSPDSMYIATAKVGNSATYGSLGVYRSVDGGNTWAITGLNYSSGFGSIRDMEIHPTNPNIIIAAGSTGIMKTVDAGVSWYQVSTVNINEIKQKPGDPTVMYAGSKRFYKSTDTGETWIEITSGLPAPSTISDMTLAVTADDANYVYISYVDFSGGWGGIYRSTDQGNNFSLRANTPNIYGRSPTGSDWGGQGSYNLAAAASPTNKDEVFTGGINLWRSLDGGANWYTSYQTVSSTHADIQTLHYANGYLYVGSDGGVYRTADQGNTWNHLTNLPIGQMYRLGLSETDTTMLITGWQDNGTSVKKNGSWTKKMGADGMDCHIDYTDEDIYYASTQNGAIARTDNGGVGFFTSIVRNNGTGVHDDGSWVTPYLISKTNPKELLVGKLKVYKSINRGTTWAALGDLPSASSFYLLSALDQCDNNSNHIYAGNVFELFVSTDGYNFLDRTAGLPVDSSYLTFVEAHPYDSLQAWVTFSGYSATEKIYHTTDGGVTWNNISNGLPNFPVNSVVYQKGSDDRLYAATDAGVYYRDNSSPVWSACSNGIPNVWMRDIEIDYQRSKLVVCSYGRGVWETDLILETNPPIASFNNTHSNDCGNNDGYVVFTDLSANSPTTWQWSFPGGTPATSTYQNPQVYFPSTGVYPVELIVTNAYGSDTITENISVTNISISYPSPTLMEGFEASTTFPVNLAIENPDNDATWVVSDTAGGYGASANSAMFDNFAAGTAGKRDAFITEDFDFSSTSIISLNFDVGYLSYSFSVADTLAVFISTDCGANYLQVFNQYGYFLTLPPYYSTTEFTPGPNNWKTYTVDLSAYAGMNHIRFKFENRSGGSNRLFLDNINLFTNNTAPPSTAFTATNTTICEGDTVQFTDQSGNFPNSWQWTVNGGTPAIATQQNPFIVYNTAGTYDVQLVSGNLNGTDTLLMPNYITVEALPAVPVITQNGLDLESTPASGYQWFLNGVPIVGANSMIYTPITNGSYTVEITGANGCANISTPYNFFFVSTNSHSWSSEITVFPNPNKGTFQVDFNVTEKGNYTLEIVNVLGEVIYTEKLGDFAGHYRKQINLSGYSKGCYFIQLGNKKETLTCKLLMY